MVGSMDKSRTNGLVYMKSDAIHAVDGYVEDDLFHFNTRDLKEDIKMNNIVKITCKAGDTYETYRETPLVKRYVTDGWSITDKVDEEYYTYSDSNSA